MPFRARQPQTVRRAVLGPFPAHRGETVLAVILMAVSGPFVLLDPQTKTVAFGVFLVLLFAAIGLALRALRGSGRLIVVVDPGNDVVRISRTVLFLPRERVELRLGEVVGARLEEAGPVAGRRLVVALRHGDTVPASRGALRGPEANVRALATLRATLGLPDGSADELAAALIQPTDPRTSWSSGFRWLVTGVLALVALLLVREAVMSVLHRGNGTIVIYADQRCSFEGADLLPGARMELSLPPGDYSLRVWRGEGRWEHQTVHIRAGGTLHQNCGPELMGP